MRTANFFVVEFLRDGTGCCQVISPSPPLPSYDFCIVPRQMHLLLPEVPYLPAQWTLLSGVLLTLQPLDDALEVQRVTALSPHRRAVVPYSTAIKSDSSK